MLGFSQCERHRSGVCNGVMFAGSRYRWLHEPIFEVGRGEVSLRQEFELPPPPRQNVLLLLLLLRPACGFYTRVCLWRVGGRTHIGPQEINAAAGLSIRSLAYYSQRKHSIDAA